MPPQKSGWNGLYITTCVWLVVILDCQTVSSFANKLGLVPDYHAPQPYPLHSIRGHVRVIYEHI
jgi:hypothetical protein